MCVHVCMVNTHMHTNNVNTCIYVCVYVHRRIIVKFHLVQRWNVFHVCLALWNLPLSLLFYMQDTHLHAFGTWVNYKHTHTCHECILFKLLLDFIKVSKVGLLIKFEKDTIVNTSTRIYGGSLWKMVLDDNVSPMLPWLASFRHSERFFGEHEYDKPSFAYAYFRKHQIYILS